MYKFEMHLHSKGCSKCGSSDCLEYVTRAKELGYTGIVFTNHFYHGNTAIDRKIPWRDFVYAYRDDYLKAKALGDEIGLTVLFGIEEGIVGSGGKEALIYGLDAEVIASNEHFRDMSLPEMAAFVRENGGFIVCSHPFRDRAYIKNAMAQPSSENFDALEVYNNGNIGEADRLAGEYAKKVGLRGTCGGDTHNVSGFGKSAMDFDNPIPDNAELVRQLKAGAYKMMFRGEYVE